MKMAGKTRAKILLAAPLLQIVFVQYVIFSAYGIPGVKNQLRQQIYLKTIYSYCYNELQRTLMSIKQIMLLVCHFASKEEKNNETASKVFNKLDQDQLD